jgi:RNA polymerase sigma factor (sigma-70 family)
MTPAPNPTDRITAAAPHEIEAEFVASHFPAAMSEIRTFFEHFLEVCGSNRSGQLVEGAREAQARVLDEVLLDAQRLARDPRARQRGRDWREAVEVLPADPISVESWRDAIRVRAEEHSDDLFVLCSPLGDWELYLVHTVRLKKGSWSLGTKVGDDRQEDKVHQTIFRSLWGGDRFGVINRIINHDSEGPDLGRLGSGRLRITLGHDLADIAKNLPKMKSLTPTDDGDPTANIPGLIVKDSPLDELIREEEELIREEKVAKLAHCIRELSESARDLLKVLVTEKQTLEAIAKQLSITAGNLYVRKHRLIKFLKTCLEQQGEDA